MTWRTVSGRPCQLASINHSSKSKFRVKTIFIEVTLTRSKLEEGILQQKLERDIREGRLVRQGPADVATRPDPLYFKKLGVTVCEFRNPGFAGRADRPFSGPS